MGKPFSTELAALPDTFAWASTQSIEGLVRAIRGVSGLPLFVVGSGGSFTAAHLACDLHRDHTGKPACALTPLQSATSPIWLRDSGVLLPTAGGRNPDVLGAFRTLVSHEPRRLIVLSGSSGSRVAVAASGFEFVDLLEFAIPSGKDGFLAVNSLLAFSVLLARAYATANGTACPLPTRIAQLLGGDGTNPQVDKVDRAYQPLWDRQTLLVLHGPATQPAALDVESKFTEAALGNVQLADFRHFAHGRHHWLAKRGSETAILVLTCDDDRAVAERTIELLPRAIPVTRLDVPFRGWLAGLAALVRCFFIVGSAGRARGIDPGNPGVPAFGRRIYHLNAYPQLAAKNELGVDEAAAIERKSGETIPALTASGRLDQWRKSYSDVRRRFAAARFSSLVIDYDGTLCNERARGDPLPGEIRGHLRRLVRAGAVLGVATGRGKSVREALRAAIPEKWWQRVVIGYYNGADVSTLADSSCPDGANQVVDQLRPIADRLQSDRQLADSLRCTLRPRQITIEPVEAASPVGLWERVHDILLSLPETGATAVRSGHSVDIVAEGVSKTRVVERVRELAGPEDATLCIGDRGRWPGNDFALLSGPYALSVDEVSSERGTCWNLAPPGYRGMQATRHYLGLLQKCPGGLQLAWEAKRRKRR